MSNQDFDHFVSPRAVQTLRSEMAGIASSAGSVERRANDLLVSLGQVIPFAGACMIVRDPETRTNRPVGWAGTTDPVARYLARAEADGEIEFFGFNRVGPPVHASALPVPLEETLAWGEYLLPAGFVDGFTVSLYSDDATFEM